MVTIMKATCYWSSLLIPFVLSACVDANYPTGSGSYPRRDCHYYGNCGYDYYHHDYDYDRRRYYDDDRDRRERRERERERERRERERDARRDQRIVPPPAPKPVAKVIVPSCPAGTKFDGRHCKIIDQRLRRPGGDGNINPCPKGMWVAGGKCVGK